MMRETIIIKSTQREELIDITERTRAILEQSSIQNGIMHVYCMMRKMTTEIRT